MVVATVVIVVIAVIAVDMHVDVEADGGEDNTDVVA